MYKNPFKPVIVIPGTEKRIILKDKIVEYLNKEGPENRDEKYFHLINILNNGIAGRYGDLRDWSKRTRSKQPPSTIKSTSGTIGKKRLTNTIIQSFTNKKEHTHLHFYCLTQSIKFLIQAIFWNKLRGPDPSDPSDPSLYIILDGEYGNTWYVDINQYTIECNAKNLATGIDGIYPKQRTLPGKSQADMEAQGWPALFYYPINMLDKPAYIKQEYYDKYLEDHPIFKEYVRTYRISKE